MKVICSVSAEEAIEGNAGNQTLAREATMEATVVTEDSAKTGEEKAPAAKEVDL